MDAIAPGIFVLDGLKTGRSYLIEGDDGIALIDTSSGDASKQILAAITAIGHRAEDLRLIVATHYHHDHTGNAAALIERSGAQLCVHEADVPYVDGRTPWMPVRPPFGFLDLIAPKHFTLKVDRVLREGDVLPFAGGLRVIHAPGHTPGHIALHGSERRVLFAGDSLMNIMGLSLPMWMASHDMGAARASVRLLTELDYDIALPGHGRPIVGQASEKIASWARTWV